MNIRTATAHDVVLLRRINPQVFGRPVERAEIERYIHESTHIYVASDVHHALCGGIIVKRGDVLWLAAWPQNTGIGSKLLEHAERQMRLGGHLEVRLLSTPQAIRFYQRHGYEIRKGPNRYGDVLMIKMLNRV